MALLTERLFREKGFLGTGEFGIILTDAVGGPDQGTPYFRGRHGRVESEGVVSQVM